MIRLYLNIIKKSIHIGMFCFGYLYNIYVTRFSNNYGFNKSVLLIVAIFIFNGYVIHQWICHPYTPMKMSSWFNQFLLKNEFTIQPITIILFPWMVLSWWIITDRLLLIHTHMVFPTLLEPFYENNHMREWTCQFWAAHPMCVQNERSEHLYSAQSIHHPNVDVMPLLLWQKNIDPFQAAAAIGDRQKI